MRQIYLDYNATTPIAPSVIESMLPFFSSHYGNPSSSHAMGRAASEAIEDARCKIAGLIGCDRNEIVFTGCGTEANNLALKGVMLAEGQAHGHLVISAIEHPAISEPAKFLERMGCELTIVPCDENGVVRPTDVEAAIRPNTRLVSVMHANNEIGTIQPIREISEVCRSRNILLHSDASQTTGKIPVSVDFMDVDMLTIAGHKFYGPKGIGVLFVREGLGLESLLHGAGHEQGMRGGTENTPYIVGLGQAALLVSKSLDESVEKMTELRDRLYDKLSHNIPGLRVNGLAAERLPNTLSVSFPEVIGDELLRRVPEICASTGAACHSGEVFGSSTLSSMGLSDAQMASTVRLSVGWTTSEEEIDRASNLLIDAWENLVGTI
jgi:cysteine desulfurase